MINWKQRGYGILSVFFYGYGASIAPLTGFIAATDPVQFTLLNLFLWPTMGGFIAVLPKLGKTFAELSSND